MTSQQLIDEINALRSQLGEEKAAHAHTHAAMIRAGRQRDELLEYLQSTLRIVEALSYHTQLGHSQRERLDKAKALVGKLTSTERSAP